MPSRRQVGPALTVVRSTRGTTRTGADGTPVSTYVQETMTQERRTVPEPRPAEPRPPARTADVAAVLEAYVERVARLVLHASALAERMDRPAPEHPAAERLATLRTAVTRGERAIVSAVRHHAPRADQPVSAERPARPDRRSGGDRRVASRA